MKKSSDTETIIYILQPTIDGYKGIGYGLFSLLNAIEANGDYKAYIIPLSVLLKDADVVTMRDYYKNEYIELERWVTNNEDNAEFFLISINWYIHLFIGLRLVEELLEKNKKVVVGGLTASIFADDIATFIKRKKGLSKYANFKIIKGAGERKIIEVLGNWNTQNIIEEKEKYSVFNKGLNYSFNDFSSNVLGWENFLSDPNFGRTGYLGTKEKVDFHSKKAMPLYLGSGCMNKCKFCSSSFVSKHFNLDNISSRIPKNGINEKVIEDIKNYYNNGIDTIFLDFNPFLDVACYFKLIEEIKKIANSSKKINLQINLWGQKEGGIGNGIKLLEKINSDSINNVTLTFSFDDIYCNKRNGKGLSFDSQKEFLYTILNTIQTNFIEKEDNKINIELFFLLDPLSCPDEHLTIKIKQFIKDIYRKYHPIFRFIDFVFMPLMIEPGSERSRQVIQENKQFDWFYDLSKKILLNVPFNQIENREDCINNEILGKKKTEWIKIFNNNYNYCQDLRYYAFKFKTSSMIQSFSKIIINKLLEMQNTGYAKEDISEIILSTAGMLVKEFNKVIKWEGVEVSLATFFTEFAVINKQKPTIQLIDTDVATRIGQLFERIFPEIKMRDIIFHRQNYYNQYKYFVDFGSNEIGLDFNDIPPDYDYYSTKNDDLNKFTEKLTKIDFERNPDPDKSLSDIKKSIYEWIKKNPVELEKIECFNSLISGFYQNSIPKENRESFKKGLAKASESDIKKIMVVANFIKMLTLENKIAWFLPIGGFDKIKASLAFIIDFSSLKEKGKLFNFLERGSISNFLNNYLYKILLLFVEFDSKLQLLEQYRRSAIISILVDSFAHNIAAHSLSAIVWLYMRRNESLGKRFLTKDSELTKTGINISEKNLETISTYVSKEYQERGILNQEQTYPYFSLQDFFTYMDEDTRKNFFVFDKIGIDLNNGNKKDNPTIPIPMDNNLVPLLRYIRDKAAFWSGVTRDFECGGEIKTWYEVLWDFANNPLFLGSIAHSEGLHKVIINVGYGSRNNTKCALVTKKFVKIDIDHLFKNSKHDSGKTHPFESVLLGSDFKEIRENLDEKQYQLFLPNGIVGRHALYTIFENTLRNIKHAITNKNTNEIEFNIFIELINDKKKLFDVTIWLGNKTKLKDNNSKDVKEKIENLLKEPIIDENGNPKMGGNSQDKICASMLYNNVFSRVGNRNPRKYYPWVRVNTCNDTETEVKDSGHVMRSFYVWKGQNDNMICNEEQLKDENPSRLRFVKMGYSKGESPLKKELAEKGIVRILENTSVTNNEEIYATWNEKWVKVCKNKKVCIRKDTYPKFLIFSNNNKWKIAKIKSNSKYEKRASKNNNHITSFAHGEGGDTTNNEILSYRGHGILAKKFIKNMSDNPEIVHGMEDEFIEALLTNIEIYDNRIFNRVIEKNKINLFKTLFLFINDENTLGKKDNHEKTNFIVIHLSYIEKLYSGSNSDKVIDQFITDYLSNFLSLNSKLVITTGRGRGLWYKGLDKKNKQHVLFKPIESLLSAVEDGLMLNDDFQVKYNLVKVLFGS